MKIYDAREWLVKNVSDPECADDFLEEIISDFFEDENQDALRDGWEILIEAQSWGVIEQLEKVIAAVKIVGMKKQNILKLPAATYSEIPPPQIPIEAILASQRQSMLQVY